MITIRLKRRGRKHLALYDIIAANVRSKRDGAVLEKLGTYSPMSPIANVTINKNLVLKWLKYGAKISSTVKSLLSKSGIMLEWHLEQGITKGKITKDIKDEKIKEWHDTKKTKKNINLNISII